MFLLGVHGGLVLVEPDLGLLLVVLLLLLGVLPLLFGGPVVFLILGDGGQGGGPLLGGAGNVHGGVEGVGRLWKVVEISRMSMTKCFLLLCSL